MPEFLAAGLLVVSVATFGARQGIEGRWADVPGGTRLSRCDEASGAHERAGEALAHLDETISALGPGDDPEPALGELFDVLGTQCFQMAVEGARWRTPDSAESLSAWWSAGGHAWLASYLAFPDREVRARRRPHLVVPPDVRRTLERGDHPLAPLVCDANDENCRKATAGWRRRAEARLRDRERTRSENDDTQRFCRDTSEQYGEFAYQAFRGCLETSLSRPPSLPLGALRPPTSGWLVVRGRRGHYEFCDEIRAYNLANGDAFRAASCSSLVLEKGGEVHFTRTRELARDELDAGTLNLENLRETAWMLLMTSAAERVRRSATYVELPEKVSVLWIQGGTTGHARGEGYGGSTAHTTLSWRVVSNDVDVAGRVRWPGSYDATDDHAVELLAIAEESWQVGCPKAPPPAAILGEDQPPVNYRDADADDIETTADRLARSVAQWNASSCESGLGR